jgi:hypothetical protein
MNIEKNLGNVERVVRLFMGLSLIVLAMNAPVLNGIEWFVAIISSALILNGIFSRCYLWYVLDINTTSSGGERCMQDTPV